MRPLRLAVIVGAIASFAASGRLWVGALSPGTPELLPPAPEPQRVVLSPPPPVVVHAAVLPTVAAGPRKGHRASRPRPPSAAARGVATAAGPVSPVVYHPQAPSHPAVAAPSAAPPKQHAQPKPTPTPKPVSRPPVPQPSRPTPTPVVVAAPPTQTAPAQPSSASDAPAAAPTAPAPTETSSPSTPSGSTPSPGESSSPAPQQEQADTRPGNGWGDDNHVHTGPPGQDGSHGNGNQGGHDH